MQFLKVSQDLIYTSRRNTNTHYYVIRNHISFDYCSLDNSSSIRDSAMGT